METKQAIDIIQQFLNEGIKAGLVQNLGTAGMVVSAWTTIVARLNQEPKKEPEKTDED